MTVVSYDTWSCRTTVVSYDTPRCRTTRSTCLRYTPYLHTPYTTLPPTAARTHPIPISSVSWFSLLLCGLYPLPLVVRTLPSP